MKVLIAVQDQNCVGALGSALIKYPFPPDTEFRIIHVVPPVLVNDYRSFLPSSLTEEVIKDRYEIGKKYVQSFSEGLKSSFPNIEVTNVVCEGSAKEEITQALNEWKADLLVVGSHRKSGLESLGSVSKPILSSAPCPVLVVPVQTVSDKKMHVII